MKARQIDSDKIFFKTCMEFDHIHGICESCNKFKSRDLQQCQKKILPNLQWERDINNSNKTWEKVEPDIFEDLFAITLALGSPPKNILEFSLKIVLQFSFYSS